MTEEDRYDVTFESSCEPFEEETAAWFWGILVGALLLVCIILTSVFFCYKKKQETLNDAKAGSHELVNVTDNNTTYNDARSAKK